MIILERDGSISHCSPIERPDDPPDRAYVALTADVATGQPESSVIDKVLGFAFDVLGISKLEVQVYEHSQR